MMKQLKSALMNCLFNKTYRISNRCFYCVFLLWFLPWGTTNVIKGEENMVLIRQVGWDLHFDFFIEVW